MAAPRQIPFRLVLLLIGVTLLWWALDHWGSFGTLNNIVEDGLFRFRGQIPAYDGTKPDHPPLKIIYVDVDAPTISLLGERPWSREYYAHIIDAICKRGGAKAVGLDFILSPTGMKSKLVDPDKAHKSDETMGLAMETYKQTVIATAYSNIPEPDWTITTAPDAPAATDTAAAASAAPAPTAGTASPTVPEATAAPAALTTDTPAVKDQVVSESPAKSGPAKDKPTSAEPRFAEFPYLYKNKSDPTKNAYPESPTYPLIGTDRIRTGMVDVATDYNPDGTYAADGSYKPAAIADSMPRWVPLFADTTGTDHTDNISYGFIIFHKLPPELRQDMGDKIMLLNPEGGDPFILPKIQSLTFYNLSVKLALIYLGLDEKNVHRTDEAMTIADNSGKVLINIPLEKKQLIEINWFSKWDDPEFNPHVSAREVIIRGTSYGEGTAAEQAETQKFFAQFKDAIVLIGPVDRILHDLGPTPFDSGEQPLVGVYGNLLKTFFSGDYIHRIEPWIRTLIQFILTALVGCLALYSGHGAGLAKGAAVIILLSYIALVFESFAHFTLILPLVAPVGSAFSVAFVGAIVRLLDEEKQKKRIKGMFGTYLAPEVVNDMVESGQEPQLGGHNVNITCFFSDVQGFSTFSEVLTPGQLTNLMNEYFTAMTEILQHERGSLDKFIGDAIVAMYGAPIESKDHALRACIATCRMQKSLGELRQKWISEGDKWPKKVHQMRMRIGLNTGETIVGNMGSAARFNYTMMGDAVNLAARCESSAKQFGVYGMCTEDTKREAVAQGNEVVFRRLNKIKVKGKTVPVEVYEITCLREDATPDTLRCVELFEQALELYFSQKWDEAKVLFAEAQKMEPLQPGRDPNVAHNPSELMQEECDEMKANPPPSNWDGVKELTEK